MRNFATGFWTDAYLRAIEIHEGLIDCVKEVLNTICSMARR